jgi:hypothetical protein
MKKFLLICLMTVISVTKVLPQSKVGSAQGQNLIQLDLGTPYQWIQQFSRAFRVQPLRFSIEYLRWVDQRHRLGITIDADYSNLWYQYAGFAHHGRLYGTSVFLQHLGLYGGIRAILLRFPWRLENGIFFEPQIGMGYEHTQDHLPNVQLIARPQFLRIDWRFRLGAMFPLSTRFRVSPSLEYTRINGPYFKDFSPIFLAEINLGFSF